MIGGARRRIQCTGHLPSKGRLCYTLGMAKNRKPTRKPMGQNSGKHATPATRETADTRLDAVYRQIREILEQARAKVARSVNTEMVRAYWLVGREVVEEEQKGSARAGYGDELIDQLAARLRADFGRGYTSTNLRTCGCSILPTPTSLPARFITRCVMNSSARRGSWSARRPRMRVLLPACSTPIYLGHTTGCSPRSTRLWPVPSTRSRPPATTGRRASWSARSTHCSSNAWPRAATRRD